MKIVYNTELIIKVGEQFIVLDFDTIQGQSGEWSPGKRMAGSNRGS